jgi:hypothetical protein
MPTKALRRHRTIWHVLSIVEPATQLAPTTAAGIVMQRPIFGAGRIYCAKPARGSRLLPAWGQGGGVMRRFADWLFSSPNAHSDWSTVAWWEVRRVPFNIIVGTYGALCFVIFVWAITTSGRLAPGDDAEEPIALLAAPIVLNILYTLGWFVEIVARTVLSDLSPRFGPVLFKCGLGLTVLLISFPAGFWAGYRLLQLAGCIQ